MLPSRVSRKLEWQDTAESTSNKALIRKKMTMNKRVAPSGRVRTYPGLSPRKIVVLKEIKDTLVSIKLKRKG